MDKNVNTNASPPTAAIREAPDVTATPVLALAQEHGGQTVSGNCKAQRTAMGAVTAIALGPTHPPDAVVMITPTAGDCAPVAGGVALSSPVEDAGEQQKQGLLPSTRASGRNKRSAASPFIPPSVAQQRRDILHCLIRKGEISPEVTLNDEGKVTLAIKSLAFIKRNLANKALLYRELEHANFWYGGDENQNSPVSQQDAALRLWLTQLLFDTTWEQWITNHLIPEQSGSNLTVRRWREIMYDRLLDRVEYDASPRRREVDQLWQFIVLEHFPLLQLHGEAINALRIDSYDWHDLYAGTLFLHYASDNYYIHRDINFAQDVGNLLYILSRVTGQYGYFFRLPALVQTAVNTPRTQGEPAKKRPHSLSDYFAARNAHLEAHDLVTAFQDAMGQWRTRRQLAKELIEKHYPHFSPEEQAEHLQRYLFPYAGLTLPRPPAAPPAPHYVLQDLPHLDEAYRQRTEKVGKSYLAQDRWLCATGWNALADDEHVFLRRATIQLIQLGHLMPSQPHPEGSTPEHGYQQKENVDIFMATSANEERRYIAVNAYDGYSVKRVNKLEDHLGELIAGPSQLQVGIRVSPVMQMKSEQQTLATFLDAIAHRHQQIFTSRLGEYGKLTAPNAMWYQKLVAKMTFTDGFQDNPAAAGASVNLGCRLNTHLLVAVVAKMRASAKNGAMRPVMDAVMTGIRSKLLLSKRTDDELRFAHPTATNGGQAAVLQHRNARAVKADCRLDPDVEGIYALSKAAVEHIVAIGYATSEYLHDNGRLLAELDDRQFLDRLPEVPASDLVALSGQFKLTLPFQRICPQGIYVKTLPEMGVLYGPQFMLQQRQKNKLGLIEKTPGHLDVYFKFPSNARGADVMRSAHIVLDLNEIATENLPPLQRFVSLRSAMGLNYISEKKIGILLNRYLGSGQYFVASHHNLKQNQKATTMYPASYLHQNKHRIVAKTDEARETVLTLKRLFAEVDFWPHDPAKPLSKAQRLPHTSPIYHYLLDALGLTFAEDKIIQFAARWLRYYTERIDEEFAATPLAEKVLFVSHKVCRARNKDKHSLMGLTLRNDKNRRLFILADSFDDDIPILKRMHLLHEASQRLASVNYLHAPVGADNGLLSECVNVYEDREDIRDPKLVYYSADSHFINRYRRALLNPDPEHVEPDKAVRQRRNNAAKVMSKAVFIKQVWQDNLLRANLLLDDADTMAKIIDDVGTGRRFIPDGQARLSSDRLSQLPQKLYALIIASGRRHKPAAQTSYCFPGHCNSAVTRRVSTGGGS